MIANFIHYYYGIQLSLWERWESWPLTTLTTKHFLVVLAFWISTWPYQSQRQTTIHPVTFHIKKGLISNAHQQSLQLRDWWTSSLPVDVALRLFAPSLGYFSWRSHVWGSACVPRIQMKAAVCKVSVRGQLITECLVCACFKSQVYLYNFEQQNTAD